MGLVDCRTTDFVVSFLAASPLCQTHDSTRLRAALRVALGDLEYVNRFKFGGLSPPPVWARKWIVDTNGGTR